MNEDETRGQQLAQRIILREKAFGQDFLAMHPVSSILPLHQNSKCPTWDSNGEHPLMLCSHTTLITHHLSVVHGLVDPNRQEFESFED